MKNKIAQITCLLLVCSFGMMAQQPPVRHASPEVRQRARDRSDYSLFRREITALKEFAEEKKKALAIQKENKEVVKVIATIDSVDTDDTAKMKTITGYITQQIGDVSANAYELTFDRTTRKITGIKRTGESTEPEVAEPKAKPATPKAEVKKAAPAKKKKTGDDEDEEEDEKEEKEDKTPASKEKDE